MPLVQAKCTNCGANLEVDNTKEAAICPYCNTPYAVEKAINNYNVTNHINAQVVNIYGGNSANFVIRAGTLEKYTGAATDVVIPNSVTIIGAGAFSGCNGLTSVMIPNSVISIENDAFHGCSALSSITIPDGVKTIGVGAFRDCINLTKMSIPDSVTSIGSWAFSGCSKLATIKLSNNITALAPYTFQSCTNLQTITLPLKIAKIDGPFINTGLTSVRIPDGVTVIPNNAFQGLKLTNVNIPNTVKVIGSFAFHGCDCLEDITIPEGVTTIGSHAFDYCNSLTKVIIPNSVTTIGAYAFSECHSLKTVTFPDNAIDIGYNIFYDCEKLHKIDASVQTILKIKTAGMKNNCYIATAVYGSYDCPQVWVLRRYRDNTLSKFLFGRAFISLYYAVSPTLVKYFGSMNWFKKLFKRPLDKLVKHLISKGVADTPYSDE